VNGLENSTYLAMLVISNFLALLLLFTAWKFPRLSRLLFFMLFTWAGWVNWSTALNSPEAYLEYASMAWLSVYKSFINGWFSEHIVLVVGCIATCQLLIAIGMQARGVVFRISAIGAIVFFISIAPLGVGSGFPCTLTMALAMYLLAKRGSANYLWLRENRPVQYI